MTMWNVIPCADQKYLLVQVSLSQRTHCSTVLNISLHETGKHSLLSWHKCVCIFKCLALYKFKERREQISMFMTQPPLNVSFRKAVMEWMWVLLGIKLSSALTKTFYLASK